jgi:hypothetical protein
MFEPNTAWVDDRKVPTDRAMGWMRSIANFIGALQGTVPIETIGGDGVSTTTFLRGDGTFAVPSYPVGADPTGQVGATAVNGTATTFLRSDGAPALNLGITPTWTGAHTFTSSVSADSLVAVNGFGCNGKTAQTEVTVNAAVTGTAGAAYTATEQGMINDTQALVNQIRAALVANGIVV